MKRRDILIILISTFILVVAWIGFNVYHNSVTSTISETLGVRISPIHPDFNAKDIQHLKERKKILPILEASVSPTPTLSPSPTSTPSALLPTPPPAGGPTITSSSQTTSGGILAP